VWVDFSPVFGETILDTHSLINAKMEANDNQRLITFAHWPDLPSDLQLDILLKLRIEDLLNFSATNKYTRESVDNNNLLWRTLFNRRGGARENVCVKTNSRWKTSYQEMHERVS